MVEIASNTEIRFVLNRGGAVHIVHASDVGTPTAPVVACCGQKLHPGSRDQEYVERFHNSALCGNCYRDLRAGAARAGESIMPKGPRQ